MADATISGGLPQGRGAKTASPGGPMLAADGTPLRASLARSLRRQKMRALLLIAPLLLFILVTFVMPIGDMLFRSVENHIVADTLPRTVAALRDDPSEVPGEPVFRAMAEDLQVAVEEKTHTQLGTRLNYESSGMSSLLRGTGRDVKGMGEDVAKAVTGLDDAWEEPGTWVALLADPAWVQTQAEWAAADDKSPEPAFAASAAATERLPRTVEAYQAFAHVTQADDGDSVTEEEPWNLAYVALADDLRADPGAAEAFEGDNRARLDALSAAVADGTVPAVSYRDMFVESDDAWGEPGTWSVLRTFSSRFTPGYYLNAVDLKLGPNGIEMREPKDRIYLQLFVRTLVMSLVITGTCILLGYPIAFLLANLPERTANLLMILVLLPFWTSLLVRTSAWKVLLQQQGVINDILVWLGIVGDGNRLALINNQTGTIIAMTHILLPFMILPLYSVMKGIPKSYVRAAKSLGANDWTAFWRVYFPQSVPGIGAGSILCFILAIGYYITPELVGGTKGVFISNRIAYHISDSLNWGLAAALGTILLAVVMLLYWAYDRLVGIDNVKLGG
ncbi:polyamine ABC transporter, permease protein [Rubellimicrobium mesophilum DSM 19309]|uniref:Polyamine ABC transporter, permease protein n=2 Tax=Rubellimicrobium TaxID=295418 RepID=A0A017HVH6_9RHOB|nr:polyamine ABC transporter, permease protein [Rubellimicrobium mesophilum DSM 19309]